MTDARPLCIPVILGTTRKGRKSEHAARFMVSQISNREDIDTELIDISKLHRGNALLSRLRNCGITPRRIIRNRRKFSQLSTALRL